jgi:hypothetical protein
MKMASKNVQNCDFNVYSRFEPLKRHCIDVLHAETKVFHEDIYVIAFFLHPSYQWVAVSKKNIQYVILVKRSFILLRIGSSTEPRLPPFKTESIDITTVFILSIQSWLIIL